MRCLTVVFPIVNGASSTNLKPSARYHAIVDEFSDITPSQTLSYFASTAARNASCMSMEPSPCPWLSGST